MTIIIPKPIFKLLFKDSKPEEVLKSVKEFYKLGSIKPLVKVEKDYIEVRIDIDKVEVEQNKYNTLIGLCEKGELKKALELAKELTSEYPTVSEYFRILGQIYSDLGEQDEAINALIDSLRWNPENEWALLMMGNIFAKHKKDIETALLYYDQILELNPDNFITLNNVGAMLMQNNKKSEALNFFNKAIEVNSEYPNTYLALGILYENEGKYDKAFDYGLKALGYSKKGDEVYVNAESLVNHSAKQYSEIFETDVIVNKFVDELSKRGGKKINIVSDDSITTAAKIEFAENYDRNYHLVKYNPKYKAVSHLVLHELIHLELVLDAREGDGNFLFTTNESCKAKFKESLKKFSGNLRRKGIPKESVDKFLGSLFDGINNQIFNTPIDLFIEDIIYTRFTKMRPIQYLSLLRLTNEGLVATTRKDIVDNVPKSVLTSSKIYNLVNAFHFRTLFNINLVDEFKATKLELNTAKSLYQEFNEYRNDKKGGEEYEIIQHWAEDLKLDSYFNLIPEEERKRKTVDEVVDEINDDPYGLNDQDPSKDRKMKKFLDEHSGDDINNAVVMFMIDALNYFKNFQKEEVKKIAFELATIGMTGIDPKKNGYSVPSIPNSSFSGYKTLSYYYVSWALAIPEMLNSLNMPFDEEYDLANKMINL